MYNYSAPAAGAQMKPAVQPMHTGAQVNNWVNHAAGQVPGLTPTPPIMDPSQIPAPAAPTPSPVPGGVPTGGMPAGYVAPPAGDPTAVPTGGAPVPPAPVPGAPVTPPLDLSGLRPNQAQHFQARLSALQASDPARYQSRLAMLQQMMANRSQRGFSRFRFGNNGPVMQPGNAIVPNTSVPPLGG